MNLPVSDDQHLWVSWTEYHRAIEQLALRVHESGWKFDQVLCLARGGLRPGDVFSRIFDTPLAILPASSYRADGGTTQGTLDIGKSIAINKGTLGGRVLLIDDLVDSGVTLQRVMQHLRAYSPLIIEIKSAVIWRKASAFFMPDFCLFHLDSDPWIHQPFEQYDSLRPDQLKAWLKKGDVT